MPEMTGPSRLDAVTSELTPTKLLTSALESIAISGLIFVLSLISNASPLATFFWTASSFALSLLVLRLTHDTRWSLWSFFGLLALGLLALALAAVQQRRANEKFELTYAGVHVARLGHSLPDGTGQVTGVNTIIKFQNNNDFPIFYRIDRRFGQVKGESTSLFNDRLPPGQVDTLEGNAELECGTDEIHVTLPNGQWIPGEVECRILFGRSKEKLDRMISYSGKIEFFLCPGNAQLCGPVQTSSDNLILSKVLDRGA